MDRLRSGTWIPVAQRSRQDRDDASSSSRYGFKDEAPLADGQPQPYGEIFVMKADGSEQRPLTDNQWEDGPGAWQPIKN